MPPPTSQQKQKAFDLTHQLRLAITERKVNKKTKALTSLADIAKLAKAGVKPLNIKKVASTTVGEPQNEVVSFTEPKKKRQPTKPINTLWDKISKKELKKKVDYIPLPDGRTFILNLIQQINQFRKYIAYVNRPFENVTELYYFILEVMDYYKNQISNKNGGNFDYINLLWENKETGKTIARAISSNYIGTLSDKATINPQKFINHLNELVGGNVGSDAIDSDEYALMLDSFVFNTYNIVKGAYGSSDKILFKCAGIESKRKECVRECFKTLKINYSETDISKVISYIKEKKLNISIVSNVFNPICPVDEMKGDYFEVNIPKIKNKKSYDCFRYVKKVNQDEISLNYLYKVEVDSEGNRETEHTFIYDEIKGHLDIITNNKVELLDNVLICIDGSVIKDTEIIYTAKVVNKVSNNVRHTSLKYVFFDYETVIDFSNKNIMKEYSLSILCLTPDELRLLDEYDKNKEVKMVNEMRKNNCKTFLGHDCSKDFIKWIIDNQTDTKFVFVGFNNTNFDNFLFLDALLSNENNKELGEFSVGDIFYNGSQLLNFKMNGVHETFDIRKHLVGSLKKNCESFKINCCAKKDFDHHDAQVKYDNGTLIEYITTDEKLREYNEFDVLATAVLFARYQTALINIPSTKEYGENLYKTKTIGSLIYKVFNEWCKDSDIEFPKLDYDFYRDIQSSKIAGRVEMFNGVMEVNERLASTDVCSLYPFVMSVLNCYYPCGKTITKVNSYQGVGRLGFYYCDIDQSCLKDKNLPNIYAYKTGIENQWDYTGVIENYLISTVMIELLLEHGCKVTIRNGFVFSQEKKSCEMFRFLLEIMKAKNEQDDYKEKKDSRYNPALRETLKLLMNSLSGKIIEGLHTEKVEDFKSESEFIEIQQKAKSINVINNIGDRLFVTYEVDEKDICEKQQRPIYLGVLVYDYAKRYMYQNSYSKIGKDRLIYTDTDASKFRYSDFDKWNKWIQDENVIVPHWKEVEEYDARYKTHLIYQPNSKVFGSFEDELQEYQGDEYKFYCVEKKSWLYAWKNGEWESKFRFKGLNDNTLLLTLDEDFISHKTVNHKDGTSTHSWVIREGSDKIVDTYYNTNKHLFLGKNSISSFDKLHKEKQITVLVNSFRKIVKNSARNVGCDDESKFNQNFNKIEVHYSIKKITLK